MWEKVLLIASDTAHKGGAIMGVILAMVEQHAATVSIAIAFLGYLTRSYFDWKQSKRLQEEHELRMKKGGQ